FFVFPPARPGKFSLSAPASLISAPLRSVCDCFFQVCASEYIRCKEASLLQRGDIHPNAVVEIWRVHALLRDEFGNGSRRRSPAIEPGNLIIERLRCEPLTPRLALRTQPIFNSPTNTSGSTGSFPQFLLEFGDLCLQLPAKFCDFFSTQVG